MNSIISFTRTVTVTGLVLTGTYGAIWAVFRGRRAWRNMKIIQSVDTGSVWTTE